MTKAGTPVFLYEGGTYAVSGLGYGSKKSRELLSWIQDPVHSIKKFHSQLFIKCQEENCMLFMQLLLGGIVYSFGNQSFAAYFICRIILCMRQILYSIRRSGYLPIFFFRRKKV